MSRRLDFNITSVMTDSRLVKGEFDIKEGWSIWYRTNPNMVTWIYVGFKIPNWREAYELIDKLDDPMVRAYSHEQGRTAQIDKARKRVIDVSKTFSTTDEPSTQGGTE